MFNFNNFFLASSPSPVGSFSVAGGRHGRPRWLTVRVRGVDALAGCDGAPAGRARRRDGRVGRGGAGHAGEGQRRRVPRRGGGGRSREAGGGGASRRLGAPGRPAATAGAPGKAGTARARVGEGKRQWRRACLRRGGGARHTGKGVR
ncbi:hypothetical protein PVAP13_5KG305821 [Panicum virgatum]|uniref:Uncharacterized protein n=1 Tax=Panicum virgatum TaxID=38727 RepID=A0A8T0SL75_PANVG|nr:hypothetical protein PVAP13_5KG305821 [Panicum virgatum]